MSFTTDQVQKVYFGREGCACGCRGTYYVAKETHESRHLGETPNAGMVTRALNLVNAALANRQTVREVSDLRTGSVPYVSVSYGTQAVVTVYLKAAA